MKKKAKSGKSPAKSKAKSKAKPKVKAKSAKPKLKVKPKTKAKAKVKAKAKPKAAPKKAKGLSVADLFRMKQEHEQAAAQDSEAWKHKKDLPAQDHHHPEDRKAGNAGKKSGYGGARHH